MSQIIHVIFLSILQQMININFNHENLDLLPLETLHNFKFCHNDSLLKCFVKEFRSKMELEGRKWKVSHMYLRENKT